MNAIRQRIAGACLIVSFAAAAVIAEDSAKLPVVAVGDAAALKANDDNDVFLEGTCKAAVWSDTGKVMNVTFVGTEETGVSAVAFGAQKKRLDATFNGDVAKSLTGAKLRIRGHLRQYAGKSGERAHPEVTISDPSQITIEIDN